MNTAFLLMAQYGARAVIPLAEVVKDYFAPLTVENFIRKCTSGEIKIPVTRLGTTQKSAKGIHLQDLADYLDTRRAAAITEAQQLRT